MMIQAWNPSTWRQEAHSKLEASLGYHVKPCLTSNPHKRYVCICVCVCFHILPTLKSYCQDESKYSEYKSALQTVKDYLQISQYYCHVYKHHRIRKAGWWITLEQV